MYTESYNRGGGGKEDFAEESFFFDGGKGGASEEREARAEVSRFRRIPEVDIVGDWLIAI